MIWVLKNGEEIIEEFATSHSISLEDAIELCGFEKLNTVHIDDPGYKYKGKELWYDDLSLELK